MSGVRMEAEVHIITGSRKSTDNVIKCVNRAGYMVKGIVLEPLACAETILNEEEKELGKPSYRYWWWNNKCSNLC